MQLILKPELIQLVCILRLKVNAGWQAPFLSVATGQVTRNSPETNLDKSVSLIPAKVWDRHSFITIRW